MADISPQAHADILRAIREAQADVRALRANTKVQQGYVGFDLAESTLAACHEAVSGVRDRAAIATMLKKAVAALALTGGGAVAPAIQRTLATLEAITNELEGQA